MRAFIRACTNGQLLRPTDDWQYGRIALSILLAVLLLALVSKWTFDTGRTYPRYVLRQIQTLIRDAIHWNTTSLQDTNLLLALVHSTYAIAYLNTARHLVSDTDIERVMGIQARELMYELQQHHDKLMAQLGTTYPELKPTTGTFGVHTGWVSN